MNMSQLSCYHSPKELYEMSFLLPKGRDIFEKMLKISGELEVNVFETGKILLQRDYDDMDLSWTFKSRRALNILDKSRTLTIREIEGLSIDCDESSPNMIVCYTDHHHLVSVALISHLKKVFNCNIGRLVVTLEEVEDLSAYLEDPIFKTCESLGVQKGSLSADEMIRFLEEFPKTKDKYFSCNPGSDFVYEKSLSATNLDIEYAHWVTCDNLISADCRNITLSDSKLTSEDLNRFVKTRVESGRIKRENLTITNQHGFDMSVITSGLSVKPHNVNRSRPEWIENVVFISRVDLIRDWDRMVITIGTTIGNTVLIAIWELPY